MSGKQGLSCSPYPMGGFLPGNVLHHRLLGPLGKGVRMGFPIPRSPKGKII